MKLPQTRFSLKSVMEQATDMLEILLGVCCIIFTEKIFPLLPYLLGGFMVLSGLARLETGLQTKEYAQSETNITGTGIVYTVAGIVLLVIGESSYGIIGAVWGVFGLNRAAHEIDHAIFRAVNREPKWFMPAILGTMGLVLAIVLLIDPAYRVHEHMIYIGLELVFIGFDSWENEETDLEDMP